MQNILVVGGGGREHALAWKAAQSPQVETVWVAPGNAGTATEPKIKNIDIAATDINKLLNFAKEHHIDLTIVGPEAALAAGITDVFTANGLRCFGPTKAATQLESSKAFCKNFLHQHHIPTAAYQTFSDTNAAINYVTQRNQFPIVIKADGLAAGKGVIIALDLAEATTAINSMLHDNRFGHAGNTIVVEEFLDGEELSYIIMTDGQHILPLASSQDHKRRDDGDRGPNTGGMGAYSPAPLLTEALEQKILQTIIEPTIQGLRAMGLPYCGFLYAGLMIDKDGNPKVLEYNCRLGDPETQPILMRLESDLVTLCEAALAQKLDQVKTHWKTQSALAVVLTAGGYPEKYQKGDIITGLDEKFDDNDVKVFHAGTARDNNHVITNGGRVLAVTALGDTLADAQKKAYHYVKTIHWPNYYFRKDIGYRGIASTSEM